LLKNFKVNKSKLPRSTFVATAMLRLPWVWVHTNTQNFSSHAKDPKAGKNVKMTIFSLHEGGKGWQAKPHI